jgi:hypothetical protein
MLINKGLSNGDVITLKLVSGEEILARYVEETTSGIKVEKPMVLAAGPKGLGMAPYIFTVDPDRAISISHSAIVIQSPTEKSMADQYLQSTTGIAMS